MKTNHLKTIHLIDWTHFAPLFSPRARNAHKGSFGHVCVIGGDRGMGGAVCLASEAALRVGAGLVSAGTRPEHVGAILSTRPEIMVHGIADLTDLQSFIPKSTVLVLGPGLGKSDWSRQLFESSLSAPQPKIVDADALHFLAQKPMHSEHWILTPHPGEAAHLLDTTAQTIQSHRAQAAQSIQQKYGGVVVLKGHETLIATSDSLRLCNKGNPGMASGGMGDVLSGIIGGLLAQGFEIGQAAKAGVYLHAMAGDWAAQEHGERGLLARDLMVYLRRGVNLLLG